MTDPLAHEGRRESVPENYTQAQHGARPNEPRESTGARLMGLTDDERSLLVACVNRYIADIRQACAEDQGTPDGEPSTVGRVMQERLAELKGRLA